MVNRVPLPAGTTIGKSYEYGVDVNVGTYDNPTWLPVRRMFNFSHTPTPTTTDAATYDDLGAPNNDVTGWGWGLGFSTQVNRSQSTGLYLPEIEALIARTRPSALGSNAEIDVRWYHKPESGTPNPTDAGRGIATVASQRSNTGPDGAIEVLAWTLSGKGPYDEIDNPFEGWQASVPTLSSAAPSARTTGQQVTVKGFGFSGATAVKFGTTDASAFSVVNNTTIVATVPAGSAGSVNITVTTPAGTSTALAYTRG